MLLFSFDSEVQKSLQFKYPLGNWIINCLSLYTKVCRLVGHKIQYIENCVHSVQYPLYYVAVPFMKFVFCYPACPCVINIDVPEDDSLLIWLIRSLCLPAIFDYPEGFTVFYFWPVRAFFSALMLTIHTGFSWKITRWRFLSRFSHTDAASDWKNCKHLFKIVCLINIQL